MSVRNGTVTAVVDKNTGEAQATIAFLQGLSVDSLFERAIALKAEAADDRHLAVELSFDPVFNYLRYLYTDHGDLADDSYSYTLRNLVPR